VSHARTKARTCGFGFGAENESISKTGKGENHVKIAFLKVFLMEPADSCIQNITVPTHAG
jgi:hypothetical protein